MTCIVQRELRNVYHILFEKYLGIRFGKAPICNLSLWPVKV